MIRCFRRRTDDEIAADQRVGARLLDAHLVDLGRLVSDAYVAQHGAEFLREAHEVEHAGALALEVCGHRDELADGDDACATDAGHEQVVTVVDLPGFRLRQVVHRRCELFVDGQRLLPR